MTASRQSPGTGSLSPFGQSYRTYYEISDSVGSSGRILEPKTRILFHVVALAVLSSAARKLPKFRSADLKKYIQAAVVERCATEEIEQALQHAEYFFLKR
jgi:alkylhydroperoxidase/carboxymuconolactone decarboxylase family protein YurZ